MRSMHKDLALAVLMAGFFAANPASAQKPEWNDHGPGRGAQDMRRDNPRDQGRDEARFRGNDRREEREHRAEWRDAAGRGGGGGGGGRAGATSERRPRQCAVLASAA